MRLHHLTRLLGAKRKRPHQAERDAQPDELEERAALLKRLAAGIALNKFPPR